MSAIDVDQRREIEIRDEQANEYDAFFRGSRGRFWVKAQLEATLAALRLRGARSLFDAGAGVGIYTLAIARRHPELAILAADFSPASLALLERVNNSNIHTAVLDLTREAPAERFDRALCSEVLQHIPEAGARRAAVGNLHRALRPGGRVVATAYRWGGMIRPPLPKAAFTRNGLYRHAFTERELEDLFEEAGFEEVRAYGIIRTPKRLHRGLPLALVRPLEGCLRRLGLNARGARYLLVEAVKP